MATITDVEWDDYDEYEEERGQGEQQEEEGDNAAELGSSNASNDEDSVPDAKTSIAQGNLEVKGNLSRENGNKSIVATEFRMRKLTSRRIHDRVDGLEHLSITFPFKLGRVEPRADLNTRFCAGGR